MNPGSLILCAALASQGASPANHFGLHPASAGDIDGDGVPDLLIADTSRYGEGNQPGRVWVFSGKRAALLQVLDGADAKTGSPESFGASLAGLGDLDGDGIPDFGVGASGGGEFFVGDVPPNHGGYVRIYSGRSRRVLREIQGDAPNDGFGSTLLAVGDLDRDGVADLAVAAPGTRRSVSTDHRGYVRVYSGRDGRALRTIQEEPAPKVDPAVSRGRRHWARFGASLCGPGDVDADGIPDLVVGLPGTFGDGCGSLQVLSGATGILMRTIPGTEMRGRSHMEFGRALVVLGDVNLDGVSDFVAGRLDVSVSIYSGKDGTLIRELEDPERYGYLRGFGDSLATLGDVDGDGVADFAVGCEEQLDSGDSYDVTIVSGKDGTVLRSIDACNEFLVVAAAGDMDGDHVPDLLVGHWQSGIVKVFSGRTWDTLLTIRRPPKSR